MFPPVLFTVITPSATSHFAGDLSRFVTHSSRFLPSNSTIASEGAAPQVAPGVTTGGTGSQISVSSGFGLAGDCANKGAATAIKAADKRKLENGKRIMQRKYTQLPPSGQARLRGSCSRSPESRTRSDRRAVILPSILPITSLLLRNIECEPPITR